MLNCLPFRPACPSCAPSRARPPFLFFFPCPPARPHFLPGARPFLRTEAPKVDVHGETDRVEIARLELQARALDIVVRRPLADGRFEDWPVSELEIPPQTIKKS